MAFPSQWSYRFVQLSLRTRFLIGVWCLFILLIALGIHGSSLPRAAEQWAPETPYTGFVADYLPGLAKIPGDSTGRDQLLMRKTPGSRIDEWGVAVPYELSQSAHHPAFPVVNTNIGLGQNMLIWPEMPVLHIATLARPKTWGYFFLGPQRALAWSWWFQVFACFTALSLLLEILLRGRKRLAAFGAFWFCASAYVVVWSLWPANAVLYPALATLAVYRILESDNPRIQMLCGLLLGLSLPGFLMVMYPPWQITLGYLFGLILIGLVLRDRLYRRLWPLKGYRALALLGGLATAATLIASFLITCAPALRLMADTIYPGRREFFTGGDYALREIFKGLYDLATIYIAGGRFANQTEWSSFYNLFPAVLFVIPLSRQVARSLGLIGWAIAGYLVLLVWYAKFGLPAVVARLTLLGFAQPIRADVAVGLASIILCVYVLGLALDRGLSGSRRHRIAAAIASALATVFFLATGISFVAVTETGHAAALFLFAALMAGLMSYWLLCGRTAIFCWTLALTLVATAAFFNPLSTNLDYIYKSELAGQINRLNRLNREGDRPLWLSYFNGGRLDPGMLVILLGGRTLTGVHWPPQMSLWREIDPEGLQAYHYNRFAHVHMLYGSDPDKVTFSYTFPVDLDVTISPDNPVLRSMGVRYILAVGETQATVETSKYPLIYASPHGHFSIFDARPVR
ncbi:MAG TPA: hypothetical protein VN345_12215 [Blastocatellia bacterium]|nr:hypothetical protein [Blastocatellia bacterium]